MAKKDDSHLDFELNFDDVTMIEADGIFSDVKRIMDEDDVGSHEWCIKSKLFVNSEFGECRFKLDFYHDGRVIILGYMPSAAGVSTTDLGCLTRWCQENGWKIPEPTEALIRDSLELWKRMWNTLLVDSDYLDKRFGTRAALGMRDQAVEDEDDDEKV